MTQVTILPVWHITERAAELCMFSRGCTLVYSNVKNLKNDLRYLDFATNTHCVIDYCLVSQIDSPFFPSRLHVLSTSKHKPHWMMLVPRVLEKISLGVQDKFSKRSKLARIMIR